MVTEAAATPALRMAQTLERLAEHEDRCARNAHAPDDIAEHQGSASAYRRAAALAREEHDRIVRILEDLDRLDPLEPDPPRTP